MNRVFDPKKLAKLNNPKRLELLPPKYLQEKINSNDLGVVVDVGAGTGYFTSALAEIYKRTAFYACDISHIMIDYMKQYVAHKYEGIIPLKMEDEHIDLSDSIADVVLSINLHHELDDPNVMLNESLRLLKSEGKIVIADFNKKDTGFGPPVEHRVSGETVQKQLIKSGFENVQLYDDLDVYYVVVGEKV